MDTNKTEISIELHKIADNLTQIDVNHIYTNSNFPSRKTQLVLFFSYDSLVGITDYMNNIEKTVINGWNETTDKLLNKLEPNKKQRVPSQEVQKEARIALLSALLNIPRKEVIALLALKNVWKRCFFNEFLHFKTT